MLWVEEIMGEDDVTNIKQYSHCEQIYSNPKLRNIYNTKPKERKKISNAIKSGNIGQAQNIRKISKIIDALDDGLDLI